MHVTRKHRWLLLICVAAVIALTVVLMKGRFGPRYQGLPADRFVENLLDASPYNPNKTHAELDKMGPQLAVPALARVAQRNSSTLRRVYPGVHRRLPAWLAKILPGPVNGLPALHNAIHSLGRFGTNARPAAPVLFKLLEHRDPIVQFRVLVALEEIKPEPALMLEALLRLLPHADGQYVFARANEMLRQIDPNGARTIQTLVNATSSRNASVQTAALRALAESAKQNPSLLTNHWNGLPSTNAAVAVTCVESLQSRGVLNWEAMTSFVNDLSSTNPLRRVRSIQALGAARIFFDQTVPLLLRTRGDSDARVREARGQALLRASTVAQQSRKLWRLDVTLALAEGETPAQKQNASYIIVSILNEPPHERDPLFIAALASPEGNRREQAAKALARLPATSEPILAALRALLEDSVEDVRFAATNALKVLAPYP